MQRKIVCCLKPNPIAHYVSIPPDVPMKLADDGFDFIYCETQDEFLRFLPEAEIAVVIDFKSEWIPMAKKLRWVSTYSAGKERVAEQDLLKHGVKVTFGRFHGRIMAETVLGMMLFAERGLGIAHRLQRNVPWCHRELFDQVGVLHNKVCMILGLGQIGGYVAKLTKAFGMTNIGVKRHITGTVEAVDQIITMDSLNEYLPSVDHLVLILPNVPETNGLVDGDFLDKMKPSACLHNIGRGNCIDEAALCETLRNERLRYACLDVFQTEPLPMASALRELDNILIFPHTSAYAPEYFILFFQEFMNDFAEYARNDS